ncbi:SPOR domain-containing protein [Parvicella tangerina]|uniref:SPOR domain-containing protein n=1 Tax=Parvicella tangerina TaxID=2829795 RepID=A0A916JQB5_9FLAO|nr:SPOR domain-containing protein [Parvicella tangerina]CAG5086916.1 hypothetical protein CRYO30217_03329 [Parvicella tangerina]
MKTINLKSVIILVIISLFSLSILAQGLQFRVRTQEADQSKITDELKASYQVYQFDKTIEVGEFQNYLQAMKFQYDLEDLGFSNTELVAYFNFVEIPLEDAYVMLDNRNEQDEQMISPMSETEMELALKMVQNEEFYYSIQIGVFSEEAVNKFFDFPKKVDETITSKGYYRYTYGKFYTLQDAKDALVMLQENYFETAFIVAFDELQRIPITAAMEKEERLLEESIAEVYSK